MWSRATRPREDLRLLAGWKLKADLALRRSLRNHEFLDGVDDVLNCGVVGFQAAVQFVYFGGELAVFGQHLAHAHEGADDENAHLDGPLGIEHGCRHDRAVLGEGIGWVAAAAVLLT